MTTTSTPAAPIEVEKLPYSKRQQAKRRAARNQRRIEQASLRAQSSGIGRTVRYAFLILSVLFILLPVYVLLVTSFKSISDASPARAWNFPSEWIGENWVVAWDTLKGGMMRSAQLVIPSSIISAILGSMNGFVLSRWRFPGANIIFTLILFGMFIPYQAVMIPLLNLVQATNVPNGIPALILVHVIYGIPICTLIFRNYYETIPMELIEAARVDGAGLIRTYFSVVLPISIPSFVVVLIWQFTAAWNDFLFALFLSSKENGPVTLAVQGLGSALLTNYPGQMAGAVIASMPTLLVYILLGKYFMGGLMSGSVKG